jgi:hypothetical protein
VSYRLNYVQYELAPQRIADVAELKSRMARGELLYWTMIYPPHALLVDPEKRIVTRLAFFRPLWGLQRSRQIRHDRYDGTYQVFLPTTPALEEARARESSATIHAAACAGSATPARGELPHFEPSI